MIEEYLKKINQRITDLEFEVKHLRIIRGRRICRKCKVDKKWIRKDPFSDFFLDDEGRRWNSAICYECHRMGNE